MIQDVKINLGAGTDGIEGWINIDNSPLLHFNRSRALRFLLRIGIRIGLLDGGEVLLDIPPNYLELNLARLPLPFATDSVACYYSSHFLEHLPRSIARNLCADVYRTLRPKGIFRIVVPDLEFAVNNYLQSKKHQHPPEPNMPDIEIWKSPCGKLNAYFSKFPSEYRLIVRKRWDMTHKIVRRLLWKDQGHQWMYDFEDMKALLLASGFRDIQKVGFRAGRCPDVTRLDIEGRRDESLYVEAIKHNSGSN